MPMGTRHRVNGILKDSRRGLIIEVDGGGAYLLDTNPGGRKLLGRRVTVEGVRSGFDLLDVERIDAV